MFCGPLKMTGIILFWGEVFYQFICLVQLFATPWTAAWQASLSITNSQSLLKLMSIESVIPSNHLMLCQFYKCQLNSVGWQYSWFLLYSSWFSLRLLREGCWSCQIYLWIWLFLLFFHPKFYSSGFFPAFLFWVSMSSLLFIYLLLTVLGLRHYTQAFSSCSERWLLFFHWGAHASHCGSFSWCGAQAQELCHVGSVVSALGLQRTRSTVVVHGLSCSKMHGIFSD